MKRTLLFVVLFVAAIAVGIVIGRGSLNGVDMADGAAQGEREILYYKAPMDPNFRSDTPGTSPMGMELVAVYADEAGGAEPGVVSINPKVVSNLGVRTAAVERSVLSRRIETVGYVGYDEDTSHQINTRVDGWIEKLSIKATGDPVKRGQTLFELYSPTLVNAQEEYLAARKSRNTALHQASRERLSALGFTAGEIDRLESERRVKQRIRITAPSDGVVTHLGVREGVYIMPATEVMAISDLDQVWLLVEVFERQAAWVKSGQRAEVTLDYFPGERWQGIVDYVYPELDPKTRTLKVRLRFDNPNETLRPNMFARVTIHGTEIGPVVHVPQEALIRGGSVNRVVLALGDGRFRAQPVQVGMESGDRIEIRSGLSADERVVTSGQFLIDSESNIESALARMDESSEAPSTSVRVAAVVRGIDAEQSQLRLEHGPVPQWSWPAMTMNFSVASKNLLEGIGEGQSIEVVIEKHGADHFVVTEVSRAAMTDHSGHGNTSEEMPMPEPSESKDEPMDHSGHDMTPATDHDQHDMEPGQ